MIIANNATSGVLVTNFNQQNSLLQTSMSKLSSGQRLIAPGEAPADLGISERFRAQIKNSEEAGRVIQNAINLFSTSDAWLQEVHNILGRMSELSVAASDDSKNESDRANLDLEFQQLKQEIGRIAEQGKYNGKQINANTSVATYDFVEGTIVYSQADGTGLNELGLDLRSGNTSSNGVAYNFTNANNDTVGDYTFTKDGRYLLYIDQSDQTTLKKLELATDTVTTGATMAAANAGTMDAFSRFVMDDTGRVWIGNSNGASDFTVSILDVDTMTLDAGGAATANAWAGAAGTAASSSFAVHGDSLYYFNASNEYVKQNLFDQSDSKTLFSDVTAATSDVIVTGGTTFSTDNVVVSRDGLYVAAEDAATGIITVINSETSEQLMITAGTLTTAAGAGNVTGLGFDANNNLYWTDTGDVSNHNTLNKAVIKFGDKPELVRVDRLRDDIVGHFGAANTAASSQGRGLSVSGGSPAANLKFQIGADSGMSVDFRVADIDLIDLGLSRLDVRTHSNASNSLKAVSAAIDEIAKERAIVGSEVSRLQFTFSANASYNDNISQAESRIRDVDFATESTNLVSAQIKSQAAASMLSQINQARQLVLQLLQ